MMVFLFLLVSLFCGPSTAASITVYTYDSFSGKGSLGEFASTAFEKKFGTTVKHVSFPSAGEALNQIALEGESTRADVLVGVDNSLLSRAKEMKAFEQFVQALPQIPKEHLCDPEMFFVPIDYGYLAFIYDSSRTKPAPSISLKEFAQQHGLRKQVVIEDPRTSSIGLGMLLWTKSLFKGKEFETFWKHFGSQLLTISSGWSGAYGLFLKKEAQYVLSYTTSPAYHMEKENNESFRAIHFSDGHYQQTEGAMLVKTSKNLVEARKYVSFLLSDEVQKKVPTLNWMYPIIQSTKLPDSFLKLPPPPKPVRINVTEDSKKQWLREWALWMSR